jgi:3-deoxy-D-manno-octulosonic-acid transferase
VIDPVRAILPRLSVSVGEPVAGIVTTPMPDTGTTFGQIPGRQAPPEDPQAAERFLDAWRPDLGIVSGADLPLPVLRAATRRNLPLYWVNARVPRSQSRWRSRPAEIGFAGFESIFPATRRDTLDLRQAGVDPARIDLEGPLREVPAPLSCNDAERDALARRLGTRPVWLATAIGETTADAVSQAHRHASRMSHRLLLVAVPAGAETGPDLARRFEAEGWSVGLRSAGDRPDPETQVFVADRPGEIGLWYRLAPICFMAATLRTGDDGPSPFDPATLGSAVIHGPHTEQHSARYDRLSVAGATRAIGGAGDLGPAVAELLAPDKTAALAEAAWRVTSEGAEVSDRVLETLAAALEGAGGSA